MRVLLVEDDPMIGEGVKQSLKDASYAVDWVRNGEDALLAEATHSYDGILLDLGLPGRDGFNVLSALRNKSDAVPVIIITARDGLNDRIRGLDEGADDYVMKPFEMGELLARMRAVFRRKSTSVQALLTNGIVSLDPATHMATVPPADPVHLTNREFGLLQALLTRPGAILSRGQLEERRYGWGQEVESNAVEFLIHSLRKKLGGQVIKNVRGAGWRVDRNP